MAETITVADLDINTKNITKRLSELSEQIKKLKDVQKSLKGTTEENSDAYIKNEVRIKQLSKEQATLYKVAVSLNNVYASETALKQRINELTSKEIITIEQAKKSTSELLKLRNNVNASTKTGADIISQLNKKVDENDAFIRKNSSSLEKQRINIGNYKSDFKAAFVDILNGNIQGGFSRLKTVLDSVTTSVSNQAKASNTATEATNMYARAKIFLASVSKGLLAGITALGAAIVYTVKNMIGLEDQLANVRKVTGITAGEVSILNDELKKIDTRTAKNELLSYAVIAGKLGVEGVQNIAGFVRAADKLRIALGNELGASAEKTLEDISKLTDILGIKNKFGIEDSMERVGSALLGLANSGTASGEFIVDFTKTFAPLAKQANIAAEEVFAIGATIQETGQESDVSAGAISKFILQIASDIPRYAKVAGVSLKEFSNTLRESPVKALELVLAKLKTTGGGVEELANNLSSLGVVDVRERRVLASLAGALDLLNKNIEESKKQFNDATLIQKNFQISNETTGAELSKLGNVIKNTFESSILNTFFKGIISGVRQTIESISSVKPRDFQAEKSTNVKNSEDFLNSLANNAIKEKSISKDVSNSNVSNKKVEVETKKALSEKDLNNMLEVLQKTTYKTEDYDRSRLNSENSKAKKIRDIQLQLLKYSETDAIDLAHKQKIVDLDYTNTLKENRKQYNEYYKKQQDKLTKEKIDAANFELDQFIKNNQTLLDNETFLTNELLQQENKRVTAISEKRKALLELELSSGQISAEEHKRRLILIEDDLYKELAKNSDQRNKAVAAKAIADADVELEILKLTENDKTKILIIEEDKRYQSQIDAAIKTGVDLEKLEKEHQLRMSSILQEAEQRRYEILSARITAASNIISSIEQIQSQGNAQETQEIADKYDNEKQLVETQYQQKLDANDRLVQSEEQRSASETAINQEKANKLSAIDQQRDSEMAALKQQQAERERQFAVLQASLATVQAVAGVISNWGSYVLTLGPILGPIIAGAQIATVVALAAQNLSAAQNISSNIGTLATGGTKTQSIQQYDSGGVITGTPNIKELRNGDNMLITARTGEVILNKQQQESIGYETLANANIRGFTKINKPSETQYASLNVLANSINTSILTANKRLVKEINNVKVISQLDTSRNAVYKKTSIVTQNAT